MMIVKLQWIQLESIVNTGVYNALNKVYILISSKLYVEFI